MLGEDPGKAGGDEVRADPVPPGFEPLGSGGDFIRQNGPLFLRRGDPPSRLGLLIEPRHCNPFGRCHGGMLATFCDMLFPIVAQSVFPEVSSRFLPTVSLSLDIMNPVLVGSWIEGEAEVLRLTGGMLFMQGLVRSRGSVCVRSSGVLHLSRIQDPQKATIDAARS